MFQRARFKVSVAYALSFLSISMSPSGVLSDATTEVASPTGVASPAEVARPADATTNNARDVRTGDKFVKQPKARALNLQSRRNGALGLVRNVKNGGGVCNDEEFWRHDFFHASFINRRLSWKEQESFFQWHQFTKPVGKYQLEFAGERCMFVPFIDHVRKFKAKALVHDLTIYI